MPQTEQQKALKRIAALQTQMSAAIQAFQAAVDEASDTFQALLEAHNG